MAGCFTENDDDNSDRCRQQNSISMGIITRLSPIRTGTWYEEQKWKNALSNTEMAGLTGNRLK